MGRPAMTEQRPDRNEARYILWAVEKRLAHALRDMGAVDVADAVHGVRKRLKSARALLWALEDLPRAKSRKAARHARARLGKAGALLAGARDAEVMAETAAANGFNGFARRLRADIPPTEAVPLERAARKIAAVQATLEVIRPDAGPFLQHAILRCYRASRRGWRACRTDRSAETLHGWRKQVKRLYYLVSAVPGHDTGPADDLNRLGDLLGLDHDNAILAERVGAMSGKARKKRARIADTRTELQTAIFALADTVFASRPRAFAARYVWPGALPRTAAGNPSASAALSARTEGEMAGKHGSSVKDDETYEALRRDGASKEKAARIANAQADSSRNPSRKGGKAPPYEDWTKDELYDLATERGISGRSGMDKSELISALRGK